MSVQANFAARIEHTLLSPTATLAAIDQLCAEAIRYGFFGVCVHPVHVARAVASLAGSQQHVVTVVGFPLGTQLMEAKAFEARAAVALGAHEIDTVIRLDALQAGDQATVVRDVRAVVDAARGRAVKVILETGYLDSEQITRACQWVAAAGAQFVKTSTGFGPRGASVDDIACMRAVVGSRMKIKASGGIRTREQADALVAAGADRLGTSAGIALVAAS